MTVLTRCVSWAQIQAPTWHILAIRPRAMAHHGTMVSSWQNQEVPHDTIWLMGFIVIYSDLMGFYSDSMGY